MEVLGSGESVVYNFPRMEGAQGFVFFHRHCKTYVARSLSLELRRGMSGLRLSCKQHFSSQRKSETKGHATGQSLFVDSSLLQTVPKAPLISRHRIQCSIL
jgi:hypothetical protein